MSVIVDIHPHIVSHDTGRYPITPLGGTRSDWSHERSVTAEEMIAAMDEAGVDMAAMVHSSTTYGFECDYVADTVAAYPTRMTGVFSINVLEPDAPGKMSEWFARGMTGMRIYSRGSTVKEPWLALDDPRIFPCYETAAELNVSVATNVQVVGFPQLENVLKRFPRTRMILEHLGSSDFSDGPPYKAAAPLFNLARYPNLYLKVKTQNFGHARQGKATPQTLFPKLVAEFGAKRLAWGSNYPASDGTLADLLKIAREGIACLPQSDQDWILGKTALGLYPALAKVARAPA
jgi:predicted TIM-barrel fold metal-dependent hydrolase